MRPLRKLFTRRGSLSQHSNVKADRPVAPEGSRPSSLFKLLPRSISTLSLFSPRAETAPAEPPNKRFSNNTQATSFADLHAWGRNPSPLGHAYAIRSPPLPSTSSIDVCHRDLPSLPVASPTSSFCNDVLQYAVMAGAGDVAKTRRARQTAMYTPIVYTPEPDPFSAVGTIQVPRPRPQQGRTREESTRSHTADKASRTKKSWGMNLLRGRPQGKDLPAAVAGRRDSSPPSSFKGLGVQRNSSAYGYVQRPQTFIIVHAQGSLPSVVEGAIHPRAPTPSSKRSSGHQWTYVQASVSAPALNHYPMQTTQPGVHTTSHETGRQPYYSRMPSRPSSYARPTSDTPPVAVSTLLQYSSAVY